jgi:hypothetical protein
VAVDTGSMSGWRRRPGYEPARSPLGESAFARPMLVFHPKLLDTGLAIAGALARLQLSGLRGAEVQLETPIGHIARSADVSHLAAVEQEGAVAGALHSTHVVLDEDDRFPSSRRRKNSSKHFCWEGNVANSQDRPNHRLR